MDDSLTYNAVSDVGGATNGIEQVTVMAQNKRRPVIRLPAPDPHAPGVTEWVFTGADGSTLALEGLFISGGDIVLRSVPPENNKVAQFASVTLTCCTLTPAIREISRIHPPSTAKRWMAETSSPAGCG